MTERVVHVIDDDPAMRDSLAFLLDTAGLEARVYDSATAFLDASQPPAPGCILTDVRMPDIDGLELIRRLKDRGVTLPVVVMTGHADVPLAIQAMKLGVADFIEKPFDDEVLLAALEAALTQGDVQAREGAEHAAIRQRMDTLSAREAEVLQGLIAGQPNKIIAFELGISPRTVEIYRANVMTKMQAASLSELVRMALLLDRAD